LFIYNFWTFRKYFKQIKASINLRKQKLIELEKVENNQFVIGEKSEKHQESNIDHDLESYREEQSENSSQKYRTAVKKPNKDGSKSEDNFDDEDSEITKVLIHSTKAEDRDDEIKETEENEVFREAKKNLFEYDEDDKEYVKMLSPHNPFEAMEDTLDIRDKVVHLSTINTDENLEQNNFDQNLETEDQKYDDREEQKRIIENDEEQNENIDGQDSVVKLDEFIQESKGFEEDNKENIKQQLFSGPDSLLREIISHTPRSSGPIQSKKHNKTKSNNYEKSYTSKEDNSDAATKKRVDISNLGGSMTPNSSISSQFFQNNTSFQQFSLLQFNNMIESKDFGVLLQLHEKAVKYREKTERKLINKMMESQKFSPRLLNRHKLELERWVTKEKDDIRKTKNHLLEKWNKTKEMVEETEKNAKIIKQQIGSIDCSRKASLNFASPVSEHGMDSNELRSFKALDEKQELIKNDEENTKVIHFSKPHRLIHSESENLGLNESNSEKSLRISILRYKSEDIEINKNKIQLYKLQRTREMNRISSLITSGAFDDRKNQSETLNIGKIFARLLDEDNDDLKHLLQPPKINKEESKNQKIFEYTPQEIIDDQKEDRIRSHEIVENLEYDRKDSKDSQYEPKLDIDKPFQYNDRVMQFEDDGEIKPRERNNKKSEDSLKQLEDEIMGHHRQSSSNSNIGIKKCDDLNIEDLLCNEEDEDQQDYLQQPVVFFK